MTHTHTFLRTLPCSFSAFPSSTWAVQNVLRAIISQGGCNAPWVQLESWGCSGRDLEITGLHQQLAALLMLKAAAMGLKKCVPGNLGVREMFILGDTSWGVPWSYIMNLYVSAQFLLGTKLQQKMT